MAKKPAGGGNGSRWRRRPFTLFSGLSLLLCLTVCGLWVRSYSSYDSISWNRRVSPEDLRRVVGTDDDAHYDTIELLSSRGAIEINSGWRPFSTRPHRIPLDHVAFPPCDLLPDGGDGSFLQRHGFRLKIPAFYWVRFVVNIPIWPLAVASLLLPSVSLRRCIRAVRRRRKGRCPQCGYDLRATPDRCPECGRSAAPKGGAA
jgi:hypothetical protein